MKKEIIYLLALILCVSCEDVIDVELPETEPKLIVEGLLRVDKSEEFINVEIKMKETSSYFDENQPVQVESAVITYGRPLNDGLFETLAFSSLAEKEPGTGIYIPDPDYSSDQQSRYRYQYLICYHKLIRFSHENFFNVYRFIFIYRTLIFGN